MHHMHVVSLTNVASVWVGVVGCGEVGRGGSGAGAGVGRAQDRRAHGPDRSRWHGPRQMILRCVRIDRLDGV